VKLVSALIFPVALILPPTLNRSIVPLATLPTIKLYVVPTCKLEVEGSKVIGLLLSAK
jgi:hypothetical protein